MTTEPAEPRRMGLLPLMTWRYLVEYARRPLNLVLLAVVPVVFVTLSAGSFADFAKALGGFTDRGTIEAATAGWAASLLTGIAGFFHVTGSRNADRRLAAAGAGTLWACWPASPRHWVSPWSPAPARSSPWPFGLGSSTPPA
jgi:hypothetical protein